MSMMQKGNKMHKVSRTRIQITFTRGTSNGLVSGSRSIQRPNEVSEKVVQTICDRLSKAADRHASSCMLRTDSTDTQAHAFLAKYYMIYVDSITIQARYNAWRLSR